MEFSALTPLYHEELDDWGLARGTRVWMADGGYKAVEELAEGDMVLGVSFRVETEWLPRHPDRQHPSNFVRVRRPYLVARRVLAVRKVEARAWQLTFGTAERQSEARRLVAGADTRVVRAPLSATLDTSMRIVDLPTAVENPRVGCRYMEDRILDPAASLREGRPVYIDNPAAGEPRGEMVTVIPMEAYGGQMGFIRTDVRPYTRYLFLQVREVVPIHERFPLYQIEVQPDTEGGVPVRANLVAQTPFRPGRRKSRVVVDELSRRRMEARDWNEYVRSWDEWVKEQRSRARSVQTEEREVETEVQGQFYATLQPEIAAELERRYGIRGGFLNGGILIDLPVDLERYVRSS